MYWLQHSIWTRQKSKDSFGSLDLDRLDKLLGNDPEYVRFTSEQIQLLDSIPALTIDRNWFMIFDVLMNYKENYNGEGQYWNNWFHVWKIFSVSPFANALVYSDATSDVTNVTVTPSTATLSKGASLQLTVTVATTGLASKDVTWTISSQLSSITQNGLLTIAPNETAATITVTATSKGDANKKGTATITIPESA